MPHISPDFKTKKAFKQAIADGKDVYLLEVMFPIRDGREVVEAPADYHRWYAQVEVKNRRVMRVIS